MGLLSNRRRVLSGLPYDYEVEYLESTGKEYIDTGIEEYIEDFDIKFEVIKGGGGGFTSHNPTYGWYAQNSMQLGYSFYVINTGSIYKNIDVSINTIYRLIHKGTKIMLCDENGEVLLEGNDPTTSASSTFTILKLGEKLGIFRLYYIKIPNKIDAIPVAKNGIGYMYDRVSHKLFGAQGGGKFVVGPRKIN